MNSPSSSQPIVMIEPKVLPARFVPIDLAPDLQATFSNGKLVVLRRGVVREFESVSEYLDTVAAMGGSVPSGMTQALRELERLTRYGAEFTDEIAKEKGTRHWL